MGYRVTVFRTLFGSKELVELGDSAYGEWIVYENRKPKYHINLFREKSESDKLINELIFKKGVTFDTILNKINRNRKLKLSLMDYPWILIEKKSEIKELDLKPLPLEWIEETIKK